MSNDGNQLLLGRLAVHKKLITMEQLVTATREQGRFGNENRRLGEILVQMGFLTPQQLEQLLVLQRQFLAELGQHAPAQASGEAPGAAPAPAGAPSASASAARAPAAAPAPVPAPVAPSPVAPAPVAPSPVAPSPVAPSPVAPSPAAPARPAVGYGPPESARDIATDDSPSGLELDLDRSGSGAVPVAPGPSIPAAPAVPAASAAATSVPLSVEDESGPSRELTLEELEENDAPPPASTGPSQNERKAPSLVALSAPPGKAERLDGFLATAARRGASDIHVHPGAPAKVRIGGVLVDATSEPLGERFCEEVLREALNEAQRALLDEKGQIDFSYSLDGIGRFRANLYRGLTGLNGVFRFIPSFVPSIPQLGLPTELSKLTTFHQGLVLVTGPAGCGKSTTLASLVNIINEERNDHILTIEDPIEYLHPSKRCLVNQRQVNRHSESFARALRAALREDPDVIVIGELRDLETISLALTAAETGHLVLGTLHTSSAIRTVNRLVGAYPPDEQPQVRAMLSESLRAVISQRLLPRKDGQGRVAALEVLHVNKAVANTIRENKTFQLRSMMQTGRAQGMLLLDQSLQDLVRAGVVSKEEAARHVEDPRFLQ